MAPKWRGRLIAVAVVLVLFLLSRCQPVAAQTPEPCPDCPAVDLSGVERRLDDLAALQESLHSAELSAQETMQAELRGDLSSAYSETVFFNGEAVTGLTGVLQSLHGVTVSLVVCMVLLCALVVLLSVRG